MSVVTNELGYLEYDYLTRDYLEGVITIADGLQFRAKIVNVEANPALQLQQKIQKQDLAGLQTQGLINVQQTTALQFLSQIVGAENTAGLQAEYLIEETQAQGAQFQGLITDELPVATQFLSQKINAQTNTGLQAEQVINVIDSEGVQYQALITKQNKVGAQFEVNNVVLTATGLQLESVVEEQAAIGVQAQNLINETTAQGLQLEAKQLRETDIGLQFLSAITTANNNGLQSENLINETAPIALQAEYKRLVAQQAGLQFQSFIATNNPLGVEFIGARGWPHYQCGPGYLEEFGYLMDWPYLAPRICVAGGAQFEAISQQLKEYGLQVLAKDYDDNSVGMQFQGKIFEAPLVGVQFAGKRYESALIGLQFQGKIYETETYGEQFQGKIYEAPASGLQFEALRIYSVGMQVRVAIYNTTNLRILLDFPSRGTSGTNWTASSTSPSSTNAFNVNNLNTDIVEQAWRSAPGTSATLTCDTQNPSGVFVDTVALLNHNLSGGATVVMQASTDGISWVPYANLTNERENMYWLAPSLPLTPYRYFRFIINDSGASYLQVGTIVFGSAIIFQGECFVDTVRFGKKQFADRVFTEGHTNISNDRGKKRYLGLEFQDLNYGKANFRQLRAVFDEAGTILKALWIPTPQSTSRFAVFGKLEDIPEETHNTKGDDYVSVQIKVDESL